MIYNAPDRFGNPPKCTRHPLYRVGMAGCPACWEEEKKSMSSFETRPSYQICPHCNSGIKNTTEEDGLRRITYKCGSEVTFMRDEVLTARGDHCKKVEAKQAYPIR